MKKIFAAFLFLCCKTFSQSTVIKVIDKHKYLKVVNYVEPGTKCILNFKPQNHSVNFDAKRICVLTFDISGITELYLLGTSVLIEPNDTTEINVLPNGGSGFLLSVTSKFKGNFLWRQKLEINERKALEISNSNSYSLRTCKLKLYENYVALKDSFKLFSKRDSVSEKAHKIFTKELFYYYLKTLCERVRQKRNTDIFENDYFEEFQFSLFNDTELLNTSQTYRICLMLFFDDVTERFSKVTNYLDPNIYLHQIEKGKKFGSPYTRDFLYAQMINYYYVMKNDLGDDVSALLSLKDEIVKNVEDENFKKEILFISENGSSKRVFVVNNLALKSIFLLDSKKEEISLQKFLLKNIDKVIVLDIWASWCVPCLNEFRYYPEIIKNVKDTNVLFVTVSIDEHREQWLKKVKKLSIGFDYEFCLKDTLSTAHFKNNFLVNEIPRTIIYKQGNQISNFHAANPSGGEILEYQIYASLKSKRDHTPPPPPPPPPPPIRQ